MALTSMGLSTAARSSLRVHRTWCCLSPRLGTAMAAGRQSVHSESEAGGNSKQAGALRHTPLFQRHVDSGAKMVDYAGYAMPLSYAGRSHVESHRFTRDSASLFDVSHMAQHRFCGAAAARCLEAICPSDLLDLAPMSSVLTTLLLADSGGIVDDAMVTRLGLDDFFVVTNAARRHAVGDFFRSHLDRFNRAQTSVHYTTQPGGLLALQGPRSAEILQGLVAGEGVDLATLYFGHAAWLSLRLADGSVTRPLLVARGGYTGEDGFEIVIGQDRAQHAEAATSPDLGEETQQVADAVMAAGGSRVQLAGLAVRDSLRIEAGMCLYGHELDERTTPVEAGLSFVIGRQRRKLADFPGAGIILGQLAARRAAAGPGSQSSVGPGRWRVGLTMVKNGPSARDGALVLAPADSAGRAVEVGHVTSGTRSPSLGVNILMAYVRNGFQTTGTKLRVQVGSGQAEQDAIVTRLPFVPAKYWREPSKP